MGVGGAAIVVAGLTGCSSEKKAEEKSAPASAATATSGSVSASAGAGTAKVTIDGETKDFEGQILCATAMGNLNISIGDSSTGIQLVMNPDASKVSSVALGNIDGVALTYQEGAPGGSADVARNGKNYTVTGTATGIDMANPMSPTMKPFEIEVTCP